MDINPFIQQYGNKVDDAANVAGVPDGVIAPVDLQAALQQGLFGSDSEAAQFAQSVIDHPDSADASALTHYTDFLSATNASQALDGPAPEPVHSFSALGSRQGHSNSLHAAVNSANPKEVKDWIDGKQAYPVSPEALKDVNTALNNATNDPVQRAWLMAHVTCESTDLRGAANGDGKGGLAYNVSPYNLSVDMVKWVAGQALTEGDTFGIGKFANASDQEIKGISTLDASKVMLGALQMWGYEKTEAFIRSGSTGYNAIQAYEKGAISNEEATRQWAGVDPRYAPNDRQQWLDGFAQRTAAILKDDSLKTGEVQARSNAGGF